MDQRELMRGFCTLVAFDRNINIVIHPHPITKRIVKIGLDHFLGAAHIGGTFGVVAGISLATIITMAMRRRYRTVEDILKYDMTFLQMEKLLSTVEKFTTSPSIMNLDSGVELDFKDAIAVMIIKFMRAEFDCEVVLLPR